MGNKRSQHRTDRKLTSAERQRKALRLRSAGASYEAISAELGYRDRSGAWRSVHRALAKLRTDGAIEARSIECERLDALLVACWPKAVQGDTKAIGAALRIAERRARLLGLDAPSRLEVSRLLESEDWARVRSAITRALADFPEAAVKVAEALRRLGDD